MYHTVDEMLSIEPRLKEAISVVLNKNDYHLFVTILKAKRIFSKYVGWDAEIEELRNNQDYSTFYLHIENLTYNRYKK